MNIIRHFFVMLRRLILVSALSSPFTAALAAQETFATPEAAVEALMTAIKTDSDSAMIALVGDEYKDLVVQPDHAATSATRARILAAMQTMLVLQSSGEDRRVLVIGDEAWPLPIPLVRTDGRWRFASEEGAEEIVNRRIGANERSAIEVLRAYVEAQRAYASRDRNDDGVVQYAQKLSSEPGKHNGLYWPADTEKGEEQSPFGPLIAQSAPYLKGHIAGDAYRGYHFRILSRQGRSAPGGAYNYVINGRMVAGFAMVAYPQAYGDSGVMTFIVNQNGTVYEKDLGEDSTSVGEKMSAFEPDAGWKPVAP